MAADAGSFIFRRVLMWSAPSWIREPRTFGDLFGDFAFHSVTFGALPFPCRERRATANDAQKSAISLSFLAFCVGCWNLLQQTLTLLRIERAFELDLALNAVDKSGLGFAVGAVFGMDARMAQPHRHARER